jgi:GDP-D-mannose dehydratase
MFSIYTSAFNLIKNKFNYRFYIQNFSQFADEVVIAINTSEDNSVNEVRDYVIQNQKFLRPEELKYLKGDSSRIRALGWEPEYTFEALMDEMIDHWIEVYKQ